MPFNLSRKLQINAHQFAKNNEGFVVLTIFGY